VLGPFQQAFLGSVYRAITYATLFAVLLGAGAGYFFIRSITEPLKSLSLAARGVTRGEYEPQLPDQRRDEIGDLSRSFLFMTHSLRDADEWKKKIISDSAHELRTPISVLQGNIEMMLEGVYPIDRQRIEGLQEETAVLSRLVEELQQLAKAEEGAGAYRFERIDVLEPLRHVYQSSRPLAATAGIALHLEPPATALTVHADRQKLMQAITNLVQNALRYSSAGGSVVVGGEAEGADLLLYVEDSGPGIPEAERELIFERFYRIERARTRKSGGSGLGLAIVREIALAHGGRAYVEPARTLGGSRFIVRIPRSS
jgi:signal transduction histidine kinase